MSWLHSQAQRVSDVVGLAPNVVLVTAAIYVALVIGTLLRLSHLHALPEAKARSLRLRLRTWWVITLALTVVMVIERPAIVLFTALVSALGLAEYLTLVRDPQRCRSLVFFAYGSIALQYLWIYLGWYQAFVIFVPIAVFLLVTARSVLRTDPEGFLHSVGTLHWGLMIIVFCFSHVAGLLVLPDGPNPAGGSVGLFLYLVILTELNDIAQALWGRPFGRHKVIPRISPAKSWEGLVGGIVCTVVAALVLAPLLTPLAGSPFAAPGSASPWPALLSPYAALAGLLIAVAGFLGDITMSAVKRDCHVKDSGTMLPGQGGILDRIDSLTFTAPIFFHLIHLLYYGSFT